MNVSWCVLLIGLLFSSASAQQAGAKCVDRNKLCPYWASTGGCNSPSRVVVANCPVSCGACAPEPSRFPHSGAERGGPHSHNRPGPQGHSGSSPQSPPNFENRQNSPPENPARQPPPNAGVFANFPSITRPSFKCGSPYSAPSTSSGRRTRQVNAPTNSRVGEPSGASPGQDGIQGFADTKGAEEGSVVCGATVISDRFLLTAAHCIFENPVSSVRLGDLNLSQDDEANSQAADYEIEAIIVHPDYQHIGYNDLALLQTARRIQFNEAVYPMCISDTRPTSQSTVVGAGFGYVNETSKASHLQEVELKIVDSGECEEMFQREHSQTLRQWYPGLLKGSDIMCAGAPGKSACKGDAGGPVFQKDASERQYLVGIISRGLPCRDPENITMPNFYISVADHVDFIDSVIYGQF